jgi:hypothetical protein
VCVSVLTRSEKYNDVGKKNKMGGTRHIPDRDDEAYNILVGKTEGGKAI